MITIKQLLQLLSNHCWYNFTSTTVACSNQKQADYVKTGNLYHFLLL